MLFSCSALLRAYRKYWVLFGRLETEIVWWTVKKTALNCRFLVGSRSGCFAVIIFVLRIKSSFLARNGVGYGSFTPLFPSRRQVRTASVCRRLVERVLPAWPGRFSNPLAAYRRGAKTI